MNEVFVMDSGAYLPGLQEQQDSDAILRDRLRRSGLMGASGGAVLPTLDGLVPGEIIRYDPRGPKPVMLEGVVTRRAVAKFNREMGLRTEAGGARALVKRLLLRMKEINNAGGYGIHWLKVGHAVYESICLMGVEDGVRFPDYTQGLFLCGLPVIRGLDLEPNVVCYYG